jgi:hypothetical protein
LKIKNGGLKEKIVEGHQFAKTEENILASTNAKEDISTLEVFGMKHSMMKAIPTSVEGQVLQNFLDENGRLPKWNVVSNTTEITFCLKKRF